TLEHQAINVQDTQHLRSSAIVRVGVSTLGTDVARLGEVKLRSDAPVRLDLSSPPAGCHQTFGLFEPGGQYQAIMGALKTRSCACIAPWLLGPPPACELVMMVGLPGSGKTTWAEAHAASHPNKRFLLLSPEAVLDSMRGRMQSGSGPAAGSTVNP
ncbi:heterogeneous nuclear ribonucleoprotein U-like protein 1, partial [Haematococcus lacustris]